MADDEFGAEENRNIASLIREELAKRRITRATLADQARLSLSTLEKALAGQRPFTLATVVRLEEALGRDLRIAPLATASANGVAPEWLGSYVRPAVQWLEGNYFTIRASFSQQDACYTYMTEIHWDATPGHLAFRESERRDAAFKHDGAVSVPHQSGYIYLVTNKHGQYRLAVLSRPIISGEMFGLLTTLLAGRGSQLTPVSTPIALVPLSLLGDAVAFGRIDRTSPHHQRYMDILRRTTEEPFAIMAQPGSGDPSG